MTSIIFPRPPYEIFPSTSRCTVPLLECRPSLIRFGRNIQGQQQWGYFHCTQGTSKNSSEEQRIEGFFRKGCNRKTVFVLPAGTSFIGFESLDGDAAKNKSKKPCIFLFVDRSEPYGHWIYRR